MYITRGRSTRPLVPYSGTYRPGARGLPGNGSTRRCYTGAGFGGLAVLKQIRIPAVSVAVVSFALGLLSATALAGWTGGDGQRCDGDCLAALQQAEQGAEGVVAASEPAEAASTPERTSSTAVPAPTVAPIIPIAPTPSPREEGRASAAQAPQGPPPIAAVEPAPAAAVNVAPPAPPPAAPATGAGCVKNCGEPRYFCDTWGGGFCDDYRTKTSGATRVAFPAPGDPYSFDAFSTTYPQYDTEGPAPTDGLRGLSANEHFMTVIEDGQFGLGVMRLRQPFDFAGRTGRVHFDVDLKTSARRYVRMMISPEVTKVLTDDRAKQHRRPENAFDLWFVNGRFYGSVVKNGEEVDAFFPMASYTGQDDVRDSVDVFVSRTQVRVVVNGQELINEAVADLGFDRGYVYLSHASYNPCKDGECEENLQMFHWDNVAFDGPVLPLNSLTPAGSQDVVFNAYRADACSVAGTPADPVGSGYESARVTWRVRLPSDIAVSPADVSCSYNFVQSGSDQIGGFEIVRQ